MKILVLGGSGFIASHFFAPLARAGHAVVSCDLRPASAAAGRVAHVQADIRDHAAMRRVMAGCDAVLHLAAAHHDFGIPEAEYFDVNAHGAAVVCDAMDHHGVEDVCFYSTVAVYGAAPAPRSERTPPAPVSPYGRSKLAAEEVLRAWADRGEGRRCLILRPTATVGPGHLANMYTLIRQIERGRFARVGQGTNRKSLAFVGNLVEATLYLWLEDRRRRDAVEIFNYCDRPDLTSAEIATIIHDALGVTPPRLRLPLGAALAVTGLFDLIIKATGKNLPISSERLRKFALQETVFDAGKVVAAGYDPQVTLEEGLHRMVEWYRAGGGVEASSAGGRAA